MYLVHEPDLGTEFIVGMERVDRQDSDKINDKSRNKLQSEWTHPCYTENII